MPNLITIVTLFAHDDSPVLRIAADGDGKLGMQECI